MQRDQALTQWALLSMLRQGGSNFIGGLRQRDRRKRIKFLLSMG